MKQATSASFPILSDSGKTVSKAYGVYDLLGDEVAAPSVFFLSKEQVIGYYIGTNIGDRVETSEILKVLREYAVKG